MLVSELCALINELAPFDTQESWDNCGLLTGRLSWEVSGVHFALDVTERVIDEAAAAHANVIVTHHPLMFSPRRSMTEEDYEGRLLCRMIRERIALITAHTCLDRAPGGVNDTLASLLDLRDVRGEGFLRVGLLPVSLTAGTLPAYVSSRLNGCVRVFGQMPSDRPIRTLGVSSGGGSEFWQEAASLGAEAFLTGEMKHHHALALADAGLLGLEGGHFATEEPGIFALADALQTRLDALQCPCLISRSKAGGYAPPART